MEAISEDEDAAAAAGVNVTAEKLKITLISALMTALAGALYCQYQMFISPDTVSGIAVSLQMVFAVIVGGLYVSLGPTVGAVITILLAETLRIGFGTKAVGWDNLVYGVLLVLFIIFLPKGILGSIFERLKLRRRRSGSHARAYFGASTRSCALTEPLDGGGRARCTVDVRSPQTPAARRWRSPAAPPRRRCWRPPSRRSRVRGGEIVRHQLEPAPARSGRVLTSTPGYHLPQRLAA